MAEFAVVVLHGQTLVLLRTVWALAPLLLMDIDSPAVGASQSLRRFIPIRRFADRAYLYPF